MSSTTIQRMFGRSAAGTGQAAVVAIS